MASSGWALVVSRSCANARSSALCLLMAPMVGISPTSATGMSVPLTTVLRASLATEEATTWAASVTTLGSRSELISILGSFSDQIDSYPLSLLVSMSGQLSSESLGQATP